MEQAHINWFLMTITGLCLVALFMTIRGWRSDVKAEVVEKANNLEKETRTKMQALEKEINEKHNNLIKDMKTIQAQVSGCVRIESCDDKRRINMLEVEGIFNKALTKFKDEIFEYMRGVENCIQDLKDHSMDDQKGKVNVPGSRDYPS